MNPAVILLGKTYLTLNNTIANSLIGTINSIPKEWQPFIRFQSDIEAELRELAKTEPTNSVDFLRFFLTFRQRFREALLVSVLPEQSRAPIVDLIERRSAIRDRKEKSVSERDYEQASNFLTIQKTLTNELNDELAGQDLFITIANVTDAIGRIGWPENDT